MRLSNAQVRDVVNQTHCKVLPEEHPAVRRLEEVFGHHTFFLGDAGLTVIERLGERQPEDEPAFVVKVARWDDGTGTKLIPQRAEVAGTVDIGPEMADLPAVDPETGEIEREGDALDPLAGHGRRYKIGDPEQ
ncbi:MAG TPA: hypothetical protein VMT54_16060 [Candidatus Cybelea sp.]|nr:hypothetical protein [Candidatus Cybelea sp.]